MSKLTTVLLVVIALIPIGCRKKSGPGPNHAADSIPPTSETMQVRELIAPARVEGTLEGDLDQVPAMLARLRRFAADVDSKPVGPPVLHFTRLTDAVHSTLPRTEVYLPAAADPEMPEGGDDIAIVRTVSCRIATLMVQGSLRHPLPELAALKQWADKQGLDTGPIPGAILHTPEAPLDQQKFELFYPIHPETPLPAGTYSLCSPPIGGSE
jgi:effector-binding domain-containing protein